MYDIIFKKREGGKLSREEIKFFVEGYTKDLIPDYQASALLMTFFFNSLDSEEVFHLTQCMRDSGDIIDLSAIEGIKVDKHSTGGVGDKTTIIVAPIVAASGVPVAKMSGRGLGFTGGTVDKLEAIPGFKTSLSESEFINQVNNIGISVIGQTGEIAPADKKMYALRDVTATIDSLGLIASSVMSKKLAAGSDAIVLDVKCGRGAFMHKLEEAIELAEIMVAIGKESGKMTTAVITDMDQPLGHNVGNAVEVIEAIDTLKGIGPEDITELSLTLSSYMIYLGGASKSVQEGYMIAQKVLENGSALEKFAEFITAQGGDTAVIDDYSLFPHAEFMYEMHVENGSGYINTLDALTIGSASLKSGAGRLTKGDEIDLAAGVVLHKKIGDMVKDGDTLLYIYGNDKDKINAAAETAKTAFEFSDDKPILDDLVKRVIT